MSLFNYNIIMQNIPILCCIDPTTTRPQPEESVLQSLENKKFSQASVQPCDRLITPHDWIGVSVIQPPLGAITLINCFLWDFIGFSHGCGRIWAYTSSLHLIEVCVHLFMNSSHHNISISLRSLGHFATRWFLNRLFIKLWVSFFHLDSLTLILTPTIKISGHTKLS